MAILVGAYRLSELTGNLLPSMAIDTEPLQEPVPVKQGGEGSNPFAPTNKIKHLQDFLVSAYFFPNTIPAPKVKIQKGWSTKLNSVNKSIAFLTLVNVNSQVKTEISCAVPASAG